MKKSTPPYLKHASHQVDVCPTYKANGFYYRCMDCDVFVGWLSKQEVKQAEQCGLISSQSPKTQKNLKAQDILG